MRGGAEEGVTGLLTEHNKASALTQVGHSGSHVARKQTFTTRFDDNRPLDENATAERFLSQVHTLKCVAVTRVRTSPHRRHQHHHH